MSSVWGFALSFITISLIFYYFYLTRTKSIEETKKWKKASFISGAILFFIAHSTFVSELGTSLFFVHMLQQTVTYFMVPPLILLGLTDSLLKPLYNQRILSFILTFFTNPVVALSLFNILFSLYYLPMIFDTIMASSLNQALAMIILLPLSFVMWWPLVSPAKNDSTLKPLTKIIYIVGMGAFMTPLATLIIFSNKVLYRTYESLPRVYDIAILNDQQAGGVAMKVIQMIIYCIMIAYAFSEAVKMDRSQTEEANKPISPDKSF